VAEPCCRANSERQTGLRSRVPNLSETGQRHVNDVMGADPLIQPQLPGKRPLARPREVALRAGLTRSSTSAGWAGQCRQLPSAPPKNFSLGSLDLLAVDD
jgi:hypothetical protein